MSHGGETQDSEATQDDIILSDDEDEDNNAPDWHQVGLSLQEIEKTLGSNLQEQSSHNDLISLSEAVSSILAYQPGSEVASNATSHRAQEHAQYAKLALDNIADALKAVIATLDELQHAGLSIPAVMTRPLSPEEADVMERVTPLLSEEFLCSLFDIRRAVRQEVQQQTRAIDASLVDMPSILLGKIVDFVEGFPTTDLTAQSGLSWQRTLNLPDTPERWLSTLPNLDTSTCSAAISLLYLVHEVAPARQAGSSANHLREEMRYTDILSQFLATRPDIYEMPSLHLVQVVVMLSSSHQRIKHFTSKAPHQPALSWSLDALHRILGNSKDTGLLLAHHADVLPWLFEETASTTDPTILCKTMLVRVLTRAAPEDWQQSLIFDDGQFASCGDPDLQTVVNNLELFSMIFEECFVDSIGISLQNGCATAELEAICYALIKFSSKCTSDQKTVSELVKKSVEIVFSILAEAATSLAALPPTWAPLLQVLWHAPLGVVQGSADELDLKQLAPKLAFQITTDTQALRTKESNMPPNHLENAICRTIAVLQVLCRSSDDVLQILKTHHTIAYNLATIILMQLEEDEWNENLVLSALKLLSEINVNARAPKVDEVLLGLLISAPYFRNPDALYYVTARLFTSNAAVICSENATSAIFVAEHLRDEYLRAHDKDHQRQAVLEAGLNAMISFLKEASPDQVYAFAHSPLTLRLHHILLKNDSPMITAAARAARLSLSQGLQTAFDKPLES